MNTLPVSAKRLILLVALTTAFSLIFGIQYYLKGPAHLAVVNEIRDLALSPNGSLVAAGAQDGTIRLWNIPQGRSQTADWATRELSGHTGPVVRLFFDRRGNKLVSASRDGTVRVWDVSAALNTGVASGAVEQVIQTPGKKPLNDASMVSSGSALATVGDDGMVHILNLVTGDVRLSIGPHKGVKRAVALSADGALVAAGDGKVIRIWDTDSGELVQTLEGNWEDPDKQDKWLGHKGTVTTLAFSPIGDILVSGGADKILVFWDLASGEARWIGDGHFAAITKVAFDAAGSTVMSASADDKAKTWRTTGGKVSATFVGHLSSVNAVAFGPGAQSVLTGGNDGTLRLWDIVNTTDLHVEWTVKGLQPEWGKLFGLWAVVSGLVGLLCLWGLWRLRSWSYLLALALYTIGPIVVLGLPLFEIYPFPPLRVLVDILILLAGLACFASVVINLFRNTGRRAGVAGVCVPFYAFAWGWKKVLDWRLERVMLIWTSTFGLTAILGIPLFKVTPSPALSEGILILVILMALLFYIWVLTRLVRDQGVTRTWVSIAAVSVVCLGLATAEPIDNQMVLKALRVIGGFLGPLYVFVSGWGKAGDLQIERRMLVWTALIISAIGGLLISGDYPHDFFSAAQEGYSLGARLEIVWPLLALALWYAGLVAVMLRESVSAAYAAPRSAPLAAQLMAAIRTRQLRNGIFIGAAWVFLLVALYSVLRRFNLDLAFMGHFLKYIMQGSGYTVLVSAASIALAVILALLGALGRLSNNPIANGISGFYISLIRGTPLLVQIYIWYLGLPRLNIVLDPIPAGILALSVNYGAYMTEIFRAGIQAIGKGQHEAAQALGMSRPQTLRRIVLPQAFRIVIPPIGNEFIAMMKDSSLVSIMTVQELTWRANKLGRQYFRGMETFVIAAAFYWVLTVIFQFLQGKLETYMARGERR